MDIIITSPTHEYRETDNNEAAYLKFKNRQLEAENKLLLSMLAEALGNRTIVIREETLERKPRFKIGENLGGDVLVSLV